MVEGNDDSRDRREGLGEVEGLAGSSYFTVLKVDGALLVVVYRSIGDGGSVDVCLTVVRTVVEVALATAELE